MKLSVLHAAADDLMMRLAQEAIAAPAEMPGVLAQIVKAAAEAKGAAVPPFAAQAVAGIEVSETARRIAESLAGGGSTAVFLGNFAQHHREAGALHALALALAELTGARLGSLGETANGVGGYLAGAVPQAAEPRGMNAAQMLAEPRKAYLLLGLEAELDTGNPRAALAALKAAELVVALSPFEHRAVEYAHVLLPVSPFTETAGTYVSTEGRVQSFKGVVKPLGETRPAWKVLRVLGNLLGLPGFEQSSAEAVREEVLGAVSVADRLDNGLRNPRAVLHAAGAGLERIAEVPIYDADPIVRRAPSLQRTRDAAPPQARMNRARMEKLGVRDGDTVRVRQGGGEAVVTAAADEGVAANCVRLACARPETAGLGAPSDDMTIERVAAREKVAM
jgi:NADH-quinone oxidoreductase subunit G